MASGFCNVGLVSPEWQQVSLWFEDYVLFILAKVLLWPLAVFVHLLLLIYILSGSRILCGLFKLFLDSES